jgi:hypothetical protein
LFASSGAGHGFLIGEMPAGVFNVYKTNPVGPKNAAVTDIDKADFYQRAIDWNQGFRSRLAQAEDRDRFLIYGTGMQSLLK